MELRADSQEKTLPKRRMELERYSCRNCSNGSCARCLDNAKWEARFNALYGDAMKEYYGEQHVPMRQTRH
jgi:hypothetical protein